jgi:hypothetical protein
MEVPLVTKTFLMFDTNGFKVIDGEDFVKFGNLHKWRLILE